jgi:hypothetical protein
LLAAIHCHAQLVVTSDDQQQALTDLGVLLEEHGLVAKGDCFYPSAQTADFHRLLADGWQFGAAS